MTVVNVVADQSLYLLQHCSEMAKCMQFLAKWISIDAVRTLGTWCSGNDILQWPSLASFVIQLTLTCTKFGLRNIKNQIEVAILMSVKPGRTMAGNPAEVMDNYYHFHADWPILGCMKICPRNIKSISDAPIWNWANIPITDDGSEISADTDSRSDIQLCSNLLPFST